MTVLKTIGNYTIESQKMDLCPHELSGFLFVIGLCAGIILFVIGGIANNDQIFFLSVVIIGISFGDPIIFRSSCGVIIQLKNSTLSSWDNVVEWERFQFSNNPDKDAAKVNKIKEEFEKNIRIYIEDAKKKELEITQCCNKYKNVLEKVNKQ